MSSSLLVSEPQYSLLSPSAATNKVNDWNLVYLARGHCRSIVSISGQGSRFARPLQQWLCANRIPHFDLTLTRFAQTLLLCPRTSVGRQLFRTVSRVRHWRWRG